MSDKHFYASTFVSGLNEPILKLSKKFISDIELIDNFDGFITYKTNASFSEINNIRFFNNNFLILHTKKNQNANNLFKNIIDESLKINLSLIKKYISKKNKTFKIFTLNENKPVKPDYHLLKNLEIKISKELGLKLNIKYPQTEFYLLKRREGYSYFLLKINNQNKNLSPGQLRHDLVNILISLSDPQKKDYFLDTFCGYGSIIFELTKFPHKKIYANDINKRLIESLKEKTRQRKEIFYSSQDSTKLNQIQSNSITKIITDPPWGDFKEISDIHKFFKLIFKEFDRVLMKNGIIVLLISRNFELTELVKQFPSFNLVSRYNILVNGKKASIYVIKK